MVHRNKKDESSSNHVARPISELKDTSSFAPPPKRTATGLAPAPPRSTETRKVVAAPSRYQDPRGDVVAPPTKVSQSHEVAEYQEQQRQRHQQQQQVQEQEEPAPRGPYRVNTSGLSTDHLPPPPGRRDGADGRAPPPPSYESATTTRPVPSNPTAALAKPNLPPRLPPRTNSASPTSSNSNSNNNSAGSLINQNAANRLGAAGVSVPGLGISNQRQPPPPPPAAAASKSPPPPPRQRAASQVNELQNRFSRLKAGASTDQAQSQPQAPRESPAEGTTWEQKQAAIKTASSFQKDPSSVSLADAKSAAGTANNFRQRHGDQVAAGMKSANSLNHKYGVSNKIGGFMGTGQQQQPEGQQTGVTSGPGNGMATAAVGLAGKKKPPPPPPPKKPGLGATPSAATSAQPAVADQPPPIPLATRPTF